MGHLKGVLNLISSWIWGVPTIFLLLFCGVYLSFRTRFFQIRFLPRALKSAFLPENTKSKNGISGFGAACTALSATIGTGNIAGVAGAIALGGAGAVFWMWVSGIFSMIIKFAEIFLSIHFREKTPSGYIGGPMYYIKNGLPKFLYPLALIFAFCGVMGAFGTGNLTQINTLVTALSENFLSSPDISQKTRVLFNLAVGVLVSIIIATVLLGGGKRISSFCEKIVPFMLILYIILTVGVIVLNIKSLPQVIYDIFYSAFNPKAVTGGVIGSAFLAVKKGFARGVFSNEAGMGTSPVAYAQVNDCDGVKQGMLGIFEVFCDTILICTLTALAILSAKTVVYGSDTGGLPVLTAFLKGYGFAAGILFCIVICFFALSSIIGWGLYGSVFSTFLLGEKAKIPFLILFCGCSVLGANLNVDMVWLISEILSGLMVLPNTTAIIILSDRVIEGVKRYKG